MLSPEQFKGWQWYREIEPFGIEADDFRAMSLIGTIAAVAGAKEFDVTSVSLCAFVERLSQRMNGEGEHDDVSPEMFDRLAGVN